MNRAQRRKEQRNLKRGSGLPKTMCVVPMPKVHAPRKNDVQDQADFSKVPFATICQSIQLLINELKSRGISVYDFDHKDKVLQQIQILQGKVFFLAAQEEIDDEKV